MLLVLPMAALDLTVVVGSVGPRFHINPSIYTVINEKRHFFMFSIPIFPVSDKYQLLNGLYASNRYSSRQSAKCNGRGRTSD